jgi:hypothetical protein
VSEDGEDGYELREVENDGWGGWEEGGVDGSAVEGVSAAAAAMERSIDRIESKAIKTNKLFALLLVLHSRCGTHRVSRSVNDAYTTR